MFRITEDELESAKRLQQLNLSHRGLDAVDVVALLEILAQNPAIRDLDVSYNQIDPVGARLLERNTTLISLNIVGNPIGAEATHAINVMLERNNRTAQVATETANPQTKSFSRRIDQSQLRGLRDGSNVFRR